MPTAPGSRATGGGLSPEALAKGDLSPEALAKGDLSPVASAKGEIRVTSHELRVTKTGLPPRFLFMPYGIFTLYQILTHDVVFNLLRAGCG